MPGSPESTSSGPDRRRPSRRTVIVGAAAAAVILAGAGAATGIVARSRPKPPGKLVTPLLDSDVFTIAHHGSWMNWPEESAFAYARSVAHGVDALEMSVARTSDGVWFGLHDATLDRTSGTHGFVASAHTWREVQEHRITASATDDTHQATRPYARLDDILEAYGSTHALFVDPKVVSAAHYPELLRLVEKHVSDPRETMIAKGYCTQLDWAKLARRHGYETWGYYYGDEIAATPDLLSSTQDDWSVLGLNYLAAETQWATVRALGKTIVGHVLPSSSAVATSLDRGAHGLMISNLEATLGHLPKPTSD